jgi:hypothetical protein
VIFALINYFVSSRISTSDARRGTSKQSRGRRGSTDRKGATR